MGIHPVGSFGKHRMLEFDSCKDINLLAYRSVARRILWSQTQGWPEMLCWPHHSQGLPPDGTRFELLQCKRFPRLSFLKSAWYLGWGSNYISGWQIWERGGTWAWEGGGSSWETEESREHSACYFWMWYLHFLLEPWHRRQGFLYSCSLEKPEHFWNRTSSWPNSCSSGDPNSNSLFDIIGRKSLCDQIFIYWYLNKTLEINRNISIWGIVGGANEALFAPRDEQQLFQSLFLPCRYLFNDAEVKPFDSAQLASECFGGEMTVSFDLNFCHVQLFQYLLQPRSLCEALKGSCQKYSTGITNEAKLISEVSLQTRGISLLNLVFIILFIQV